MGSDSAFIRRPSELLLEPPHLRMDLSCDDLGRLRIVKHDVDPPSGRFVDRDLRQTAPAWVGDPQQLLDDPCLDVVAHDRPGVRVEPYRQVRAERHRPMATSAGRLRVCACQLNLAEVAAAQTRRVCQRAEAESPASRIGGAATSSPTGRGPDRVALRRRRSRRSRLRTLPHGAVRHQRRSSPRLLRAARKRCRLHRRSPPRSRLGGNRSLAKRRRRSTNPPGSLGRRYGRTSWSVRQRCGERSAVARECRWPSRPSIASDRRGRLRGRC